MRRVAHALRDGMTKYIEGGALGRGSSLTKRTAFVTIINFFCLFICLFNASFKPFRLASWGAPGALQLCLAYREFPGTSQERTRPRAPGRCWGQGLGRGPGDHISAAPLLTVMLKWSSGVSCDRPDGRLRTESGNAMQPSPFESIRFLHWLGTTLEDQLHLETDIPESGRCTMSKLTLHQLNSTARGRILGLKRGRDLDQDCSNVFAHRAVGSAILSPR